MQFETSPLTKAFQASGVGTEDIIILPGLEMEVAVTDILASCDIICLITVRLFWLW